MIFKKYGIFVILAVFILNSFFSVIFAQTEGKRDSYALQGKYVPSQNSFDSVQVAKKSSKKKKNTDSDVFTTEETITIPKPQSLEENSPINEDDVIVSIPSAKKRSYWTSINPEILNLVENGTPDSLKQAASLLHKSVMQEYSDTEKLLLYISAKTIEMIWPSENVSWNVPEITFANQYTGAIESAQKGIYDLSTSGGDFLSCILPLFAIITSPSISEYAEIAYTSCSKALEFNSESVLAYYLLGNLEERQGNHEKALACFKKCMEKDSKTKEISYKYAKESYACFDYETSLSESEILLGKYPQDTDILHLAANSSYNLKMYTKAESYILRVLLMEPDNTDFVLLRAKILILNGDFIRASSLLDVCAKTNSSSKDYLILRAELQRDWNKNIPAATQTITQALSLYPQDTEVLLLASEISSLSGNSVGGKDAMTLLNMVQEQDTKNPLIQQRVVKISISEFTKKGNWQQAYDLSSKYISSPLISDEFLFLHIEICIKLNKNSEAMSVASDIYNKDQNSETAQQAYLKVLVASGRKGDAQNMINKLLPSANSKMKSFLFYEKSFFEPDEESKLSALRTSLTSNPRNEEALYMLYEIYYNKKDWRRAQYYLKQVVALDPANTSYLNKSLELDALLR